MNKDKDKNKNDKVVVLISGGLDSATVLGILKKDYLYAEENIYAISFLYEQRHIVEIDAACTLIKDNNIKNHIIINLDIGKFGSIALNYSALTNNVIDIPKNNDVSNIKNEIPITYVPARNTLFIAYALSYAEAIGVYDIFVGINAVDYSGYPDCRPEYLRKFNELSELATKTGVNGRSIKINAPLINMGKADIIAKGLQLDVNYVNTVSCYDPALKGGKVLACGHCDACLLRLDGFKRNNLIDPIDYV